MWDGITAAPGDKVICVQDNGDASFANMDAANDFENSNRDIDAHTCSGTVLPAVVLEKAVASL